MGVAIAILYIVLIIAAIAAAFLLKPPGQQPRPPATLDDVDVPTAEEGKEINVLFGTRDIEAVNTVWYGDFSSVPVKKKAGGK